MANIDGDWDVTVNSPMGAQKMKVTAKAEGDTLTGSLSSAMGSTPISNGTINGDEFSFDAQITEPFAISVTVNGAVAGDELKGTVKTQSFGTFPMKGVRA